MDPNFRTPYSMQWNFQVQYQLARDWLLDAAYVGGNGVKLLNRVQQNPGIITPTATSLNVDARRVYNLAIPQQSADYGGAVYSGITDQASNANSNYNSLQVALTKRLGYGLSMTHSYTWSHGIDNASSLRNNGTGNIYDSRLDRGNSDTDIRHRYVGSVIYDLPFFRGKTGIMRHILGGWNVSTVISAQTGIPFGITIRLTVRWPGRWAASGRITSAGTVCYLRRPAATICSPGRTPILTAPAVALLRAHRIPSSAVWVAASRSHRAPGDSGLWVAMCSTAPGWSTPISRWPRRSGSLNGRSLRSAARGSIS